MSQASTCRSPAQSTRRMAAYLMLVLGLWFAGGGAPQCTYSKTACNNPRRIQLDPCAVLLDPPVASRHVGDGV